MDQPMRIGQVAKKLGLNHRTIRYYEGIGLIPTPKRKEAGYASKGYRLFTKEDIQRLEFIKQARHLDLSLRQIRDILSEFEEGCCSSARPHIKSLLEMKLKEIDERIEGLKSLRSNLKLLHERVTYVSQDPKAAQLCPPKATASQCVFVEIKTKIDVKKKHNPRHLKRKLNIIKQLDGCCEPFCGPDTCGKGGK